MFAPAIEIEVDLFQQIVARKASGQTWHDIACEVPFTVSELERLPWHFRDEWNDDAPHAEALHQQEKLARGINKVEAALFAASEPHQIMGLAKVLTGLLKLRQPAPARKSDGAPLFPSAPRPAKAMPANAKKVAPELLLEADEEGEEEEVLEECPRQTPEQKRVAEIAVLLEQHEERIFNEQLEQQFAAHPELREFVKERAKKHADRAPVLEETQPTANIEQTLPSPQPINQALGTASPQAESHGLPALKASLAVLLFAFVCGWFGSKVSATTQEVERSEPLAEIRSTQTTHHRAQTRERVTKTIPHARPWPLSGDD
jgi:hypothetical protein